MMVWIYTALLLVTVNDKIVFVIITSLTHLHNNWHWHNSFKYTVCDRTTSLSANRENLEIQSDAKLIFLILFLLLFLSDVMIPTLFHRQVVTSLWCHLALDMLSGCWGVMRAGQSTAQLVSFSNVGVGSQLYFMLCHRMSCLFYLAIKNFPSPMKTIRRWAVTSDYFHYWCVCRSYCEMMDYFLTNGI